METLKNLTLVQWIGVMVGLNSLLMGATPQLTVLIGATAVPYIIALATLGNGALGVFGMVVGGQGAQIKNVVADPQAQEALVKAVLGMRGIQGLSVNQQAGPKLATMAMDPNLDKIAPTPAALESVAATAKAG